MLHFKFNDIIRLYKKYYGINLIFKRCIMDKRFTFNEDYMNYEKWRPTYCEELFHVIMVS